MNDHNYESLFSHDPTPEDIFDAHLFEEPLVPVGADPTPAENVALANALTAYANRSGTDDFTSLTGFLERYPRCAWNVSLLTNLGLEYYSGGHYSKTLSAWGQAWTLGRAATDLKGKAIVDRAVGELAYMYARLGRMVELHALLESVEGRVFSGPATERMTGAREGLSNMENRPETAFNCGPFALQRIKISLDSVNPGTELIQACASTQTGFSLLEIEEISQRLGLYFQMAFREKDAAFVVPSVVHFKVEHFAAITRQEGDRYLLEDPTFGNDAWVTRETLEAEASGYFLIPQGELAEGWRGVAADTGKKVLGKGSTGFNDPHPHGPCDPATPGGNSCPADDGCKGMAVSRVHLMTVSLNIIDTPVSYSPPVGPAVRFTVRYNQREFRQPGNFAYSNFGDKWTFDWLSYITETPEMPLKSVTYYIMGGGTRTFTDFDEGTGSFAFQQYDQTKLTRISDGIYEMLSRDGTRKVFSEDAGMVNKERKIFLTSLIDPSGNAVTLKYDAHRVVKIIDAIDQETTISYGREGDKYKITKVTDPFGRHASFDYNDSGRLIAITDVKEITSRFSYDAGDFIETLTTPYGVTRFAKEGVEGNTRVLETIYPDGDRDRVEYNQSLDLGVPEAEAVRDVPVRMFLFNAFLAYRNTYYWSKKAYAAAYPDYNKATIYHWLHSRDFMPTSAGILESVKEPLEGRVWYDYAGQTQLHTGSTNQPAHVGRVLDDGSTQLYTYEYNGFGNVTKTIDPVGRTFSYLYAKNGIDLLEVRQTRAGQSELLSRMTYDEQHHPITSEDAAGQTTTCTYNARGQVLTETNAKNETTTNLYDVDGRLISVDGPLPGSSIVFAYDSVSRVRTRTDESGYTLTFDYDELDRLTRMTFPDGTFDQFDYKVLDHTLFTDRAGRQTAFEYNSIRQMTRRTDPLKRATLFQWCKCGALKSVTDPIGRTTLWGHDIQGRLKCKEYADGSKVTYRYESNISRLSDRIDEKLQVTQYDYNRDDTVSRITYNNAAVATQAVAFDYDADYNRLSVMTDGTGATRYRYIKIEAPPSLGAGQLASVDGPLANDAITFNYDELGRRVSRAIDGVVSSVTYDAAGRIIASTNPLGTFKNGYDGNSFRQTSQSYPNGQITECAYAGHIEDHHLRKITNKLGGRLISEFIYGRDVPTRQITSWSQQAGASTPFESHFNYDLVDQLTAASVSQGGNVVRRFSYGYDSAGNRLTEDIDATIRHCSYNALNQLTSADDDDGSDATYAWDAEHRLISITFGTKHTQFTYDGLGRRVGIRELIEGAEVSKRLFLWCENEICEERTPAGIVSKRFFAQGVKCETGAAAGSYFYTRDHLGSIRELTDSGGGVRAGYFYDPYGSRARVAGDMEADFGFTGHFCHQGTALCLTQFRAYDSQLGRWLSRDPLRDAESSQGPNLYAYAQNDPVNRVDPQGLGAEDPPPGFDPWCYGVALAAIAFCVAVLKGSATYCELFGRATYDTCKGTPPPTPNVRPAQCPGPGRPAGPSGPTGPRPPGPGGPTSPGPAGGSGYGGGGGQSGGGGSSDSL